MVRIDVEYEGGLRCRAVHAPSGAVLLTDAPVDNHGRGASFSPTDLLATSLGACLLTVMGIVAERHGLALAGATATVEKEMVAAPERRVGRLGVAIRVPGDPGPEGRRLLEAAADRCPVSRSLREGLHCDVSFAWGAGAAG